MAYFDENDMVIENFSATISKENLKEAAYSDFNCNDIFPDDEIIDYVSTEYNPEDVFSEYSLDKWAKKNGYVKKY